MELRASLVVVIVACSGPSKPPPAPAPALSPAPEPVAAAAPAAPAPPANSVKVTLADVGLEAGSLDRSADPCVDFYQFTCGGWLQQNQIPPDRARWARFTEIEEKNLHAIRQLLDEDAKAGGNKLGDYYTSCMDEPAIEK